MRRGVQQIASDFSIYTDRLNNANQLRTVSRLLFAALTIQWKLINFQKKKGILIIFVKHNFFQVTDITICSILVFLQVIKMDIKIAVLLVFISVIYIANAKPVEEFGKFSCIK